MIKGTDLRFLNTVNKFLKMRQSPNDQIKALGVNDLIQLDFL